MKQEWKKHEKTVYLPKDKPELITVPEFKYFTLEGKGNPNDDFFPEYIGVLYSLSYAVKMSPKQGIAPQDYFEYTVYPLEGVWDIDEEARKQYNGTLDKDTLVFRLMMRQPDFVSADFARQMIERTRKKKPHPLLDEVEFAAIEEGLCVQMLHKGSYDDEPESFHRMEAFTREQQLRRVSRIHREIYLSDARKVAPEKLRTVLRFQVARADQ
jgi:hypothetical protein